MQIAYSETEGYVPVTSMAQGSDEYLDYLSREGQDVAHYDVKIKAVKMLLANSDNTFVTPVYNGLRVFARRCGTAHRKRHKIRPPQGDRR